MARPTEISSEVLKGEKCFDSYLRCALHGAALTVLGVENCGVISHAPQGCAYLVDSAFSWQEADWTKTETLCTKLCEDEIVHGGEELLARTILEAKELNIGALFVLSACGPEIVGDDIVAVCQDLEPQVPFKLIPIECAGYRGSQYDGIDIALDVMLKKLVKDSGKKVPKSVCLIVPHANANPTWMGDLAWVKQTLSQMGIQVVATLTHKTALSKFDNLSSAEASLLLSHDAGKNAADYLSSEFGVEQICREMPLPIGMSNTRRWLLELGERFDAQEVAEKLVAEGERMVAETLRRKGWGVSGESLEVRLLYRMPVAIIADATIGIPLVRFLFEELEMTPELICLRSSQPRAREILEREVGDLGLDPKIVYNADVHKVRRGLDEVRPEAVFGSNVERHAIEGLGIPLIFEVVNPMRQFRLVDREYFGYSGILNILELIQNDFNDRWRSKERRYKARW
ncbi:MAG: nitrogenase associated protein [Dehalococcoidia bacterium]|jgi:nitrogenase molybdenum-iron protein alpha/beta subunit|nr:nitrogenase associated protein [Chloroflexota bacterium]MCK4242987.1 nitrogenase associated protein [Dehalococcoidia bacterium]